jgi:hypothetical protein
MMDNFEVELTGREAKNFDRWVVSQWDEGAFQFDDKPGTWELVSAGVGAASWSGSRVVTGLSGN